VTSTVASSSVECEIAQGGNVFGPASSVDNTLVRYDGTAGKVIQGSSIVVDDTGSITGLASLTMSGTYTLGGIGVDDILLSTDPASVSDTALVTAGWVSANAAGVTDGDKGDITVSASGATWTIDADSVTYDKIQDTTASDVLLGRSTAGAGTVEEIACTAAGRALIDDADAAAQRATLGLGTAATTDSTAYATAAQGALADTALQPGEGGVSIARRWMLV